MTGRLDTTELIPGMQVLGIDGGEIGHVKEVRARDFLLDLMMRRDVYVPFSAIEEVSGASVVLTVRADQVPDMDWESPSPLGDPEESDTALGEPEDRVTGIGDPTERGAWSPAADAYDLDALDREAERDAVMGTETTDDKPDRIRDIG